MTSACRKTIRALLAATALAACMPSVAILHGQETAPPNGAAKADPPAAAPEPAQPEKPEPSKDKLLNMTWFLLSHEGHRIGYMNKALYRVADSGPVAFRMEIHRFLKTTAADKKPTYLEQATLEMDKDWTAVAFRTTSSGIGIGLGASTIEGKVADATLAVIETRDGRQTTSTAKFAGDETFSGAFVNWLGSRKLVPGKTFMRRTIDEHNGLATRSPHMARVLRQSAIKTLAGEEDGFVVVEQEGGQITGHLLRQSGLLVRSEGQNHNLVAQEVRASEGARLDLTDDVPWQNRIEDKTGNTLSSAAFGYALTLPPYPYLPTVAADGQLISADNVTGRDGLHLVVRGVQAGDADAAKKLYEDWKRMVGPTEDVVESRRPLAGQPACFFKGKTVVGGRPATFQLATVVREHLGYLIGYIHVGTGPSGHAAVFRRFLDGVEWIRIFGRERGHWDGQDYVSDSYGYRLRLLADGWRVPEDREGVPTGIEAVREDRSAMLAVILEPVEDGATLEEAVDAYELRARNNVPGADGLARQKLALDGRPAVMLRYDANAIDGEPTESRHVIALDDGRLTILTFVGKRNALEANLKHFTATVQSFRFGKPVEEAPAPDVTEPEE